MIMSLWRIPVTRPVTVIMIFAGIILLGLLSWRRLEIELLPDIGFPRISVTTAYANVTPEEIESLVTRPLEGSLSAASGVERISSTSSEGLSVVVAEFSWGQDMDFALLALREKVDLIRGSLPEDIEEPVIAKFDPSSAPIMTLAFIGGESPIELREVAEREVKPFLQRLEGVAAVSVSGGLVREIVLEVDQGRLYAYNLSLEDVAAKIGQANYSFPAGTIEQGENDYLIRTVGEFEKVADINSVVVGRGSRNIPVYLKDVGRVVDSVKEKTSLTRLDGAESVGLAIHKEAGVNTVAVIDRVKGKLELLNHDLQGRAYIQVVNDQSGFIRSALRGVGIATISGAVLAFIVLLLFLASLRSAVIIVVSIPVSVLAAFTMMSLGGISLNLMSLGGLALAVGMLVDNSIVVLESIDRKKKIGLDAKEASVAGTKEVGMAVLASTLTTVAVFAPLVYVEGMAGVLFGQLGLTVTFGLLSSLVVAVMLVPTLFSSRVRVWRRKARVLGFVKVWIRNALAVMDIVYVWTLERSLKRRWHLVLGLVAALGLTVLAVMEMSVEFLPQADSKEFQMKLSLPEGKRIEETEEEIIKIEHYLKNQEEVKMVYSTVGVSTGNGLSQGDGARGGNEGDLMVLLKEGDPTGVSTFIRKIRKPVQRLVQGEIEFKMAGNVLGELFPGASAVTVEVSGEGLAILKQVGHDVAEVMRSTPGLVDVETTWREGQPEIVVRLDREKVASYGLTVKGAASALQTALKGKVTTTFRERDHEVDVRVRLRSEDLNGITALKGMLIQTPLGVIPLDKLAHLETTQGSSNILRVNQNRVVMVTANIEDRKRKYVMDDLSNALRSHHPPPGYRVIIGGEGETISVSMVQMRFVLILAVALIYMIMAAQFESLLQPFIVMLTLPLGFIGAVMGLALARSAISLPAIIGGVFLSGIIVNNTIVLIDQANKLRREDGLNPKEAVITAARLRLRPILMTTLTTVLGLIPLSLGLWKEARLQSPMAVTVVGGMLVGMILTLLFIPIIYTTIEETLDKWKIKS